MKNAGFESSKMHAMITKLEQNTFSRWRSSFGHPKTSMAKRLAHIRVVQDAYVYVGT